ncbi:MAG: protein-L-isoaspartate O-methyltransferase [Pseudomonadota bacterium]
MTDFAANRTMMVDTQVRPSDVTKFPIIDAMLAVRREAFVPRARQETAYVDANIMIGPNRVILEPRSLAKMLDAMELEQSDVALTIGPGLGYTAALLSRMCDAVIAVEEDRVFAADAETILLEEGSDNVVVIEGPLSEGAAKHGPYDAIVVEGGVASVPDSLLNQLKEGGRIAAIFMDGALGECRIGYRIDGRVSWRRTFNASAPILPGFEAENTFSL